MAAGQVASDKKGARKEGATIIFMDESGFSERPSIRRTWAPRGRRPVLKLPFNWKRLSAIGALATTAAGRKVRLFLSLRAGNVNTELCIEFLRNLRRHVRGRVILLWDGLPAHRSKQTCRFTDRQSYWLTVEPLPAYAPELNPVEGMWAYFSGTDLANYSAEGLENLALAVKRGARRLRRKHDGGQCFLKRSGLFPELSP